MNEFTKIRINDIEERVFEALTELKEIFPNDDELLRSEALKIVALVIGDKYYKKAF